jgi:hypothetical protein
MGLLDELIGGGNRQQEYGDFVQRYQQGPPYEGISDDEAGQRYSEVAGEVDQQTYQDSARDALTNLGPDERNAFASQLHQHAQGQGVDTGWDGQSTDPDSLAAMTSNVHQQNPDLLTGLLGGAAGAGGLGGMLGGGGQSALGGLLGGAGGGNPVMKAVVGGIAAMAAKRMMGGQTGGFGL